jgi:hypothetical protein
MQVLALLDEIRAMAQTGLNFTDDPYAKQRYARMFELVCEYYGETLEEPPAEIRDRLADELGQVTPKVGADAAIFDDEERILLMKRPGSETWCLPGGAVEGPYVPEVESIFRQS